MATQVEVTSSLTSLSSLRKIPREASLHHAFKTTQHPSPLSANILEEGAKFGSFARPATMPPAASKPRLTPKPFSREKSLETFAVVKPPVPALRPSPTAARPSLFAKAFEEAADAKQVVGSVPPLVDQNPVGNKSSSELVANVPICSPSPTNTIILIETRNADKNDGKLTAEKSHSPLQTPEGPFLFSKSEVSHRKPEGLGLQRQSSLCSESWPTSWNPSKPPERRDTLSAAPNEEKAQTDEKQQGGAGVGSMASEVQGRPKQRPVSAIFLQSLKDQKPPGSDVSDEKPAPEKSWVRKPRPLSVDLTAKFENQEHLVQRKPCQPESKERSFAAPSSEAEGSKPREMGAKGEAEGLHRARSSEPRLESVAPVADRPGAKSKGGAQTQKPPAGDVASLSWSAPKDKKYLWDLRLKIQEEENERETDRPVASVKSKEPPNSNRGLSFKEDPLLSQMETYSVRESAENASDAESKRPREGSVTPPLPSLNVLLNDAAPVNAEPVSESPGKESRIINIQQRIKELTLEQADPKLGGPRRSFRSRPLSADLTRLFSSPVATSEMKPERQSEANVKPSSRAQDRQENETAVAGTPRKPQQAIKAPLSDIHLERCGSFAKQRANGLLQSETSTLGSDLDKQTHPKSSVESGRIKTVRATMFEHNIQRRHVAADRFEAESALQQGNELLGECLRRGESWVEKSAETKASTLVPSRQAETPVDAERNRSVKPLKEEKAPEGPAWEKLSPKEKCEKISSKHMEDSLVSQRIEPRYEVLQTVGERVRSEAIAVVPEDKAVTLRSRRSSKEKKKGSGRTLDASGPYGLDDGKEEGFAPSVRSNVAETATKAAAPSQHGFSGQAAELQGNQTEQHFASVKAFGLPGRSKAFGATEDKVFKWSSENENEQSGVLFADMPEGSKRLIRLSGPSRTDTSKARINAPDSLTPGSPGEYGSQWPKPSQEAPLASVDPLRTYKQEESKVFALRTRLAPFGAQAETYPVKGGTEGHHPKQSETEERLGKSSQGASATKVSERWRRKTLPHDAGRFEEAAALSREGIKALSRRDSLQFCDGSVVKRSPESGRREEPTGESTFSPSSLRNPPSTEPKATYFAVTCQVPKEDKTPSETAFDPLKNKGVPMLAEQVSTSPTASTSRKSHLLGNPFPDTQESLERHLGKNWNEGAGKGASGLAKKEAFKYPPSEMKGETWRSLERQAEEAKGKAMAVGSPLTNNARFCLKDLEWDGEHFGPKKSSDQSHSVAKDKSSSGNYRLRVLDIDALMAEYGGDSKKTVIAREEGAGGIPDGGSCLSWSSEKASKRNFASRVSGEGSQGVVKALESPPGALWQGFSAAEFHRSEKESLEFSGSLLSPLKAGDMKFSPPYCAKPAAENPKRLLPDPISTRKKTFIVDEDNGEKLVLGHQWAKHANFSAQNSGQVCTDLDTEVVFVPCPPQAPSGGVWDKGTPSRHQGALHAEDGLSAGLNMSGVSKRKAGAKESSVENGSSAIRSGAERNSATSMLASTPPDLRRSFSEKARQSRARDSFPFGSGTREKQDQSKARQSFPPDSTDVRLNKWSAPEQACPLHEGIKQNLDQAWSKQDHESSGVRSSYLPLQRRSHSFYRDRRMGHPAADQLKQCFGKPAAEAKDTDTLVQEADSQYGTWSDQRHSGDSFALESPSSDSHVATARKQPASSRLSSFSSQTDPASMTDQLDSSREQRSTSLDRSSTDLDSADGTDVPVLAGASPDFSFLDQTPVLDSSVLKTRVQLSKRRRQHRAPISHALRRSTGADAEQRLPVSTEADSAWMFQDSTEKSAKREDPEKDERACPAERSPASQPQRLPVFPGMDHSVLKAQLRKRHEPDGAGDGSPVQSSRSPKSSFQTGVSGSRMLPIGTDKEDKSEEPSPQWLRDLKSKKRQSQYENQV